MHLSHAREKICACTKCVWRGVLCTCSSSVSGSACSWEWISIANSGYIFFFVFAEVCVLVDASPQAVRTVLTWYWKCDHLKRLSRLLHSTEPCSSPNSSFSSIPGNKNHQIFWFLVWSSIFSAPSEWVYRCKWRWGSRGWLPRPLSMVNV